MVSGSQRLSSKGIYFFVNYIYNFNVFTGFSVKTPNGGNHTVAKSEIADVFSRPARALVLNMKQFNGQYGCCYCEDKGVPRSTSALHRNFPKSQQNTSEYHLQCKSCPSNKTICKLSFLF